ncbi:zinc-dependent alcohol dehydrogenase [Paenibacillus sacheonensis]|uniref:Alcohol dehydrogenase catalytic domain-containing protein n=1 Tax=Paenibacillus sacheonensis TaxID=742054 RepID=A0A7X4YT38_9BACL|nr:alcohol dehydrogenase catalytic domain-containing protein [Paenibacillus sacheonensis]MBM7567731.1 threonine dehydrogenase-like Zn-dependent dehydrogenase [Paenibacillus sacheonensis]NBC71995.1 alcohol dehydrogenase catalytic domain-containing protein [Paenibacillus sacheonensis]
MKAVMWTGAERMSVIDHPLPEPEANEVLIKVSHVGICGSDLEGYLGHNSLRHPPLLMGHEFSGTIVGFGGGSGSGESAEAGSSEGGSASSENTAALALGDRVVVNPLIHCGACPRCIRGQFNLCDRRRIIGIHRPGAYAEHIAVPAAQVVRIPEGLTDLRASLTEPLACSLRAARRAMATVPMGNVAIIGAGAIGLLSAFSARLLGAGKIFVLDNNPLRLKHVAELGFDGAVDSSDADAVAAMLKASGPKGIDVVIDAAGFSVTRSLAKRIVNTGGTIMNIGLGSGESVLPVNDMIRSETTVLGSFCYAPQDFADALELLAAGKVTEAGWTTIRPLADGPACFASLVRGEVPHGKIILEV